MKREHGCNLTIGIASQLDGFEIYKPDKPLMKPISKILPNQRYDNKKVLSWSDIIAIEQGRYGKSAPPNRAMLFGTYVHKLIEEDKLPEVSEYRGTSHEVKVKHGKYVGTIDSYTDDMIIDYKTCSTHWSKQQARNHDQLRFYAYLLWKSIGVLPKRYRIISIETGYEEDEMCLTGSVRIHTVPIEIPDLLRVKARADKALRSLTSSDDDKSNGKIKKK